MLLLTSTQDAADVLAGRLIDAAETEVGGFRGVTGRWVGVDVAVHAVGVGRAAVAFALSRLLLDPPRAVVLLSAGPAYPDSGLADGDLAVAGADTYADLGQESAGGLRDVASLGVRIAPGAPGQTFLSDPRLVESLREHAQALGAFLTAESTSTRRETAERRMQRWGRALAETREGAAVAHACLLESVPMAHLRAIRGTVGASEPVDEATEGLPGGLLDALQRALPAAAEALDHPFS